MSFKEDLNDAANKFNDTLFQKFKDNAIDILLKEYIKSGTKMWRITDEYKTIKDKIRDWSIDNNFNLDQYDQLFWN